MAQYLPMGNIKGVDQLERPITQAEYDEVCEHMFDLGLEDGFVQELEASDAKYIPAPGSHGYMTKTGICPAHRTYITKDVKTFMTLRFSPLFSGSQRQRGVRLRLRYAIAHRLRHVLRPGGGGTARRRGIAGGHRRRTGDPASSIDHHPGRGGVRPERAPPGVRHGGDLGRHGGKAGAHPPGKPAHGAAGRGFFSGGS